MSYVLNIVKTTLKQARHLVILVQFRTKDRIQDYFYIAFLRFVGANRAEYPEIKRKRKDTYG